MYLQVAIYVSFFTMEFISSIFFASQYNQASTVTFDRPLYWKTDKIEIWKSLTHLKNMVAVLFVRLFQTRMLLTGTRLEILGLSTVALIGTGKHVYFSSSFWLK